MVGTVKQAKSSEIVARTQMRYQKPSKQKIDKEMIERLFTTLATGASLRKSCEAEGISDSSFLEHVAKNPLLTEQYAQICLIRADVMFHETIDIADETDASTSENIQKSRLQIDTRKFYLSKLSPKYRERLEQLGANINLTVKSYKDTDDNKEDK